MSSSFAPDTPARPADILTATVLPDSRARTLRGAKQIRGVWWAPIYCANCGVEGGFVPEGSTFAYWVCTPCYHDLGDVVNTYVMPDEIYWEKLKQEQLATHGRELSITELGAVVEADASPLATLLTSGRAPGG